MVYGATWGADRDKIVIQMDYNTDMLAVHIRAR